MRSGSKKNIERGNNTKTKLLEEEIYTDQNAKDSNRETAIENNIIMGLEENVNQEQNHIEKGEASMEKDC